MAKRKKIRISGDILKGRDFKRLIIPLLLGCIFILGYIKMRYEIVKTIQHTNKIQNEIEMLKIQQTELDAIKRVKLSKQNLQQQLVDKGIKL